MEQNLSDYLHGNDSKLFDQLPSIKEAVEELWTHPQHGQFTDHTVEHSERVIQNLNALTYDMMGTGKRLCPHEVFYLLAAVYLHDVGMQMQRRDGSQILLEKYGEETLNSVDDRPFREIIRDHHALVSAEMIVNSARDPETYYDFKVPVEDAGYIASIAKGHGLDVEALNTGEYADTPVGSDTIRLRLLAALLRLADELDVDRRRVNLELLKTEVVEPESQLHWWKHHYVEGAKIEKGSILLHFRLPSEKYAEPIREYVMGRLRQEDEELGPILWQQDVKLRLLPPMVTKDPLKKEMPSAVWNLLLQQTGVKPEAQRTPVSVDTYLSVLSRDDDFRYTSLVLPGMERRIELEHLYVPLAVMERMELEKIQETMRERVIESRRERELRPEGHPVDIDKALNDQRRFVILGHPGAGKTTLLKHLLITFASCKRPNPWVPVYVSLPQLVRQGGSIDDYLRDMLQQYNLGAEMYERLEEAMERGECIFLFDGLDEVGAEKQSAVRDRVWRFLAARESCPAVVTCRVMSYKHALPLPTYMVMELSPEQALEFADNWFAENASQRNNLRRSLKDKPRVMELATNPFLLTILAILVERGRDLPKRRVELYNQCTAILLELWDEARDTPRRNLYLREMKEQVLEEVAVFFMKRGERVFSGSDLVRRIGEVLKPVDPGINIRSILREIVENSGILRQLSADEYDFLHFTFQEYYAARSLERRKDNDTIVPDLAKQGHWREALLLLSGMLDDSTEFLLAASKVDDRLGVACVEEALAFERPAILEKGKWRLRMAVAQHDDPDEIEGRIDFLKQLLAEDKNGNVRYAALDELRKIDHPEARAIVEKTHIFDPHVLYGEKPFDFEVRGKTVVANADGKHPGMVFVPTGEGSGFWIDMFPVTNAEFELLFPERKEKRSEISPFDDSPVVRVTWEEAGEYAQKRGKRLPSEEEWELAAAGPSGEKFPWGNKPHPDFCRGELEFESATSRVNTVYRDNMSHFGCFEMAGNVWEWTSDWYNPEDHDYGHMVRGGDWTDAFASCSCGARLNFFWHDLSNVGFRCCQES